MSIRDAFMQRPVWALPSELELLIRQATSLPYNDAHTLLFGMVSEDTFIRLWKDVLTHKRPERKQFGRLIVELEHASSKGFSGVVLIHDKNQPDDYKYFRDVRRIRIRESSKRRFWVRALLIVEAAKAAGW